MRISQVCIDRPVLATVMSLVIALVGIISVGRLQNRELPAIDPPIGPSFTIPVSNVGVVGFLTVLTTPSQGIICADVKAVDTGPSP